MATHSEVSEFLASIERRAFKQALYAVRDEDAALDIVQDAMIRLVEKYGDRPAAELPPLFQRILQNIIHDHFRRQKVRNTWVSLFSSLTGNHAQDGDEDHDPLEHLLSQAPGQQAGDTAQLVASQQILRIIEAEVARLPLRQREAFTMRYWEEMDVAETAAVMGCSEGSVKTHCSRAVRTLAQALRAQGITL